MALRFNMFRTPKHRKYDYIPRYYNPNKEELEQKIKMAELKAGDSIEGAKARISSGLRKRGKSSFTYKSERKKAMLHSNLMLIFILVVLILGVLYFAEVYLPTLMEKFE